MATNPNLTRITVTPDGGSAITFCELNVQPSGLQGSGKIDATAACATAESNGKVIKSYLAGDFIEITDGGASVQFNPSDRANINSAINVSGSIVFTYNDGTTETTTGWIQSFIPTGQDVIENETVWTADLVLQFAGGAGSFTVVA